jgi:Transposase IS66 family
MISRAAAAMAGANRAIRCLIILVHVISADEIPIRVGPGPKTRKKYLPVACTNLLTYYFLGDRSMKTFTAFVLPDMDGTVVVHDRYQNYDAIPGLIHQLCAQHLCATWPAPPRPTPMRAGPPRSARRCKGSSAPRTPPAPRACPPSPGRSPRP